ncbi:hypothetical protein [Nocardia sp. NPDC052566]|uniref:hypothetical protein n=1 Tax=Nocardia sp. NPDC052566 TaxID=3364330 RepID=UPI0037CC47C0
MTDTEIMPQVEPNPHGHFDWGISGENDHARFATFDSAARSRVVQRKRVPRQAVREMSTLLSAMDAVNYIAQSGSSSGLGDGGKSLGSGSSLAGSGSAGIGIGLIKLIIGLFSSVIGNF